MCEHGIYLKRRQRTFLEKILGIKEVYVCSKCGHVLKLR